MSYSIEQEEIYRGDYSKIEDINTSMHSDDHQSVLWHLDIDLNTQQHQLVNDLCSDGWIIRYGCGFDLDIIDSSLLLKNCDKPRSFILLTKTAGHKFSIVTSLIREDNYKSTDKLPEEFYSALRQGLIVNNEFTKEKGLKTSPYTGFKKLNLQTYADLPQDFIDGIKNSTIGFKISRDENLMKKDHIRTISLMCKTTSLRPLTLLIHGGHPNHSGSYIARIAEDNTCEILGLNSLPGYDDQYFIDVLKEGIQQGYDTSEIQFIEPVIKIIKQKNWSCSAISACVLSQVDPKKRLDEQFDHLCHVMEGVINNAHMTRRLIARMEWWFREIYFKDKDLKENLDHYTGMKKIFTQLLYSIIQLDPPQKIDFPGDENSRQDYLRFLNVFGIKLNDKKFLSLFNEVNSIPVNEVSDSQLEKSILAEKSEEELSELEQKKSNWYNDSEAIVKKLLRGVEKTEKLTDALTLAVEDLAKHAKKHLLSDSNSERAKAGMTKLNELNVLLSEENLKDLHTFKTKLEEILNVTKPEKSVLLKNRGGFFGVYKTYSQIAAKMGSPHFTYKNRTAISSTDHYLIALFDAVSDILSSESDHSVESTRSN